MPREEKGGTTTKKKKKRRTNVSNGHVLGMLESVQLKHIQWLSGHMHLGAAKNLPQNR